MFDLLVEHVDVLQVPPAGDVVILEDQHIGIQGPQITAIIPAADRNKATVRVRIGFLERDERVLPDMGVRVAFLDEQVETRPIEAPSGVLIPEDAVAEDDQGKYVFVVRDGVVARRVVEVAGRDRGRLRVTNGLRNGERIVDQLSEDVLLALVDGTPVTEVN